LLLALALAFELVLFLIPAASIARCCSLVGIDDVLDSDPLRARGRAKYPPTGSTDDRRSRWGERGRGVSRWWDVGGWDLDLDLDLDLEGVGFDS
jgi:hypothetical protein